MDKDNKDYSKIAADKDIKLPYIIALDFDGTLVTDRFPKIGELKYEVLDKIRVAQAQGAKVILWTCRNGKNLKDAVEFCNSIDLHFDAINENIDEVKILYDNDTRKVFANEYWDDKAIYFGGTN